MFLRVGGRLLLVKARLAAVVAAALVMSTVTGSAGPAGPAAPADAAVAPVAFTPNCSAAAAGVAPAGQRPQLDASGAAYQARLAPAAATAKPTTVAYAGAKLV
ncbi:MAG TPA: pyruvate dehydrogenase complex dihydrolipoyllysine-residue acetyltransferase, partial [Mycobacteriales bacterium]|nr:pyruvate dehydrogenase complex dihydrolipoyllysine-residue acetyltransferase [Mycobacteriales bacterium]